MILNIYGLQSTICCLSEGCKQWKLLQFLTGLFREARAKLMKEFHIGLNLLTPQQRKINNFIQSNRIVIDSPFTQTNSLQKDAKPSNNRTNSNSINSYFRPFFQKVKPERTKREGVKAISKTIVQDEDSFSFRADPGRKIKTEADVEQDCSDSSIRPPIIAEKAINQEQYAKYFQLLNHYSYDIFTIPAKFKRFSSLLKQKYKQQSMIDMSPTPVYSRKGSIRDSNSYSIFLKEDEVRPEGTFTRTQNQSKTKTSTVFEHYVPKVSMKKRPSSGIPIKKKLSFSVKAKRNNSVVMTNHQEEYLQQPASNSNMIDRSKIQSQLKLRMKQITKRLHSSKDPPQTNKTESPYISRENTGSVEPWEYDIDKTKQLSDIEVNFRPQK